MNLGAYFWEGLFLGRAEGGISLLSEVYGKKDNFTVNLRTFYPRTNQIYFSIYS